METAAREKLPIVVVINNDRAWGMIKAVQKFNYQERYCGVEFTDVRYDQLAQALGCHGERVTKPAQIRPALKRAVDSGLPAVIDVIVDAEVNLAPPDVALIDGLWLEGCDVAGSVCVWE